MSRTTGLIMTLVLLGVPAGAQAQNKTAPNSTTTAVTSSIYEVEKGDTLWAIARRNKIPLAVLEAANPQIADFDRIFPGDKVNVPTTFPRKLPSYEDLLGNLKLALDTPFAKLKLENGKLSVGFVDPITKKVFSTITIPIVKKPEVPSVPTKPELPPLPKDLQAMVDKGWAKAVPRDDHYEVTVRDPVAGADRTIRVPFVKSPGDKPWWWDLLSEGYKTGVENGWAKVSGFGDGYVLVDRYLQGQHYSTDRVYYYRSPQKKPEPTTNVATTPTTTPTVKPNTPVPTPSTTTTVKPAGWDVWCRAKVRELYARKTGYQMSEAQSSSASAAYAAFVMLGVQGKGTPRPGDVIFFAGANRIALDDGNGKVMFEVGGVMSSQVDPSTIGRSTGYVPWK